MLFYKMDKRLCVKNFKFLVIILQVYFPEDKPLFADIHPLSHTIKT